MRAATLTTLALALLQQGCDRSDTRNVRNVRNVRDSARHVAGQAATESAATTQSARPVTFASDAEIFGMLDVANAADSAAAAVAAASSTNAEVRAAAGAMAREHAALRARAATLATRLGTAPSRDSSARSQAARRVATLGSVARGRDFDRVYLDGVIQAEKALLRALTTAMNATRTTEVQYLVQQAAPVILAHLDRAEALRKGM